MNIFTYLCVQLVLSKTNEGSWTLVEKGVYFSYWNWTGKETRQSP